MTLTDVQPQLLENWSSLPKEEQSQLTQQIRAIDLEIFKKLQDALHEEKKLHEDYAPLKKYLTSGSDENTQVGKDLIAQGKVGCIIMAGGMGTRLHFEGSKGMFPITQFRQKSLFQYFSDRIRAASKMYQKDLPVTIMTSSLNDKQTRKFFKDHEYFGLNPEQLSFYVQGDLPFLDQQGNLFFDSQAHIAEGPDGNGELLHHFYHSGLWKRWKEQGVEYVNIILIDNPLADPFDPELVGTHKQEQCDILVKGIKREDPKEKLGVLVRIHDKVHIVEYSELPEKDMEATLSNGDLKFPCGNLSLFSVKMDFFEKIKSTDLPLHKAFKALSYLDVNGKRVKPTEPNAWKFEKFIFDIFPHGTVEVMVYPREECFSPLKRREGADSPETVMRDLQEFDRRTYHAISGLEPPSRPFELDPQFYYPTEDMRKKWEGKALPEGDYILP
ncbi:MAG: putative uridylyltransferase [Chlamydiae bacterium]|nr:putative uridylyltransferase [Chlamydiota bacterium]